MIERPAVVSTNGDETSSPRLLGELFESYDPGEFYDEAFAATGKARPHYRPLLRTLGAMSGSDVRERRARLDRAFMNQGVTFTVYKDDAGIERIFPFDPMPRIITHRKWERLAAGL